MWFSAGDPDPDSDTLHLPFFISYSGRRRLCRAFCITYAGSCLLIQQPILPVLFAGRILGGLSTAILFSVFESWLVASFQGLPATLALGGNSPNIKAAVSRTLSLTMGRAALVNGIVAAGAGVAANWIVGQTDGFRAPFILSGILLIIAWVIIGNIWDENYGAQKSTSSGGGELSKIMAGLGMVRRGMFLLSAFKRVTTDLYRRTSIPSPWSYANLLRRIHVSIRLPLGSIPPGSRRSRAPLGLHFLLLHDLYDARFHHLYHDFKHSGLNGPIFPSH